MFIDEDLTIEEQINYYISRYNKTTDKDEKILILEIIKKIKNKKEIDYEL